MELNDGKIELNAPSIDQVPHLIELNDGRMELNDGKIKLNDPSIDLVPH